MQFLVASQRAGMTPFSAEREREASRFAGCLAFAFAGRHSTAIRTTRRHMKRQLSVEGVPGWRQRLKRPSCEATPSKMAKTSLASVVPITASRYIGSPSSASAAHGVRAASTTIHHPPSTINAGPPSCYRRDRATSWRGLGSASHQPPMLTATSASRCCAPRDQGKSNQGHGRQSAPL